MLSLNNYCHWLLTFHEMEFSLITTNINCHASSFNFMQMSYVSDLCLLLVSCHSVQSNDNIDASGKHRVTISTSATMLRHVYFSSFVARGRCY